MTGSDRRWYGGYTFLFEWYEYFHGLCFRNGSWLTAKTCVSVLCWGAAEGNQAVVVVDNGMVPCSAGCSDLENLRCLGGSSVSRPRYDLLYVEL